MQLTGPVFLFLLLPLSLLILRISPVRYRRTALSAVSLCWYAMVNMGNVVGLMHILLLMVIGTLYVYLPMPRSATGGKIRAIIGITIPLTSFVFARLLAEYGSSWYVYPIGLAYITLAMISLVVDVARGDTVRPRNPLDVVGYLLFFPTLVAGPILRSKYYFDHTEELRFSSPRLSKGIRHYMIGFIKRIAMAAVLLRALRQLILYMEYYTSPLLFFFLLFVSYFAFYFFFTGTADMARGICAMFGLKTPRDRGHILASTSPDRPVCGLALSLYNFMQDYVYRPLRRLFPGKYGHILARFLVFALSILFLRTRPEMLLFALPMLLLLMIPRRARRPHFAVRLLWMPLTVLSCSFFTLAIMLERPMKLFDMMSRAFSSSGSHLYQAFKAVRDFRYLLIAFAIFLLLIPVTYLRGWFLRNAKPGLLYSVRYVAVLLTFACFVATLIYLLPQFPGYADQAYGFYQYQR